MSFCRGERARSALAEDCWLMDRDKQEGGVAGTMGDAGCSELWANPNLKKRKEDHGFSRFPKN